MKKAQSIKVLGILFIFILSFTNCQNEVNELPENSSLRYKEIEKEVKSDLKSIHNKLKENNSNFLKKESIIEAAKSVYSNDLTKYNSFLNEINTYTLKERKNLNQFQIESVNEIIDYIPNSKSLNDLISFLDSKVEFYQNKSLDIKDKDYILTYIVTYKASLEFVSNNPNLFSNNVNKNSTFSQRGWWADWGKCVAGTLGGAGTGALGGAAIGSAVPVIGTVAGGIVGGIAGALTGAAASC